MEKIEKKARGKHKKTYTSVLFIVVGCFFIRFDSMFKIFEIEVILPNTE